MITIGEIRVPNDPVAWRDLGFDVEGDESRLGSVRLRLGGDRFDKPGVTEWTLRGIADSVTEIDGILTAVSTDPTPEPCTHPNGVTRIDHVVLMTPDLPRTTAALKSIGLDVRRERDAGAPPGRGTDERNDGES